MPHSRALVMLLLAVVLTGCASDPVPVTGERAFLDEPVQLTFADDFAKAGEAYFSPDGNWIIFQAVPAPPEGEEPSPHYSMYVAKVDRRRGKVVGLREPILLSADGSANTCGWFHPTQPGLVLFGSTTTPPASDDAPGYQREGSRYSWEFPPEMDIVTRSVAAIPGHPRDRGDVERSVRMFGHPGYCAEGSWSEDGRSVLCTAVDPATDDGDIFAYIPETGELRPLVIAPGYDGGPFFSPNGRFICYRSDRAENNLLQLYVSELSFDADGLPDGVARELELTRNEHVNWAPFWHPSGRFLVYATSQVSHRNYEVFAIHFDPAGTQLQTPVRVTHADGFDGLPVFSPDGSHMMWTAQRGTDRANNGRPSSQLWVAEVRGMPDFGG